MTIIILILIKWFVSWKLASWACYGRYFSFLHLACYMMVWFSLCVIQEWVTKSFFS
jgi:hypothetical protein